MEIKSPFFSLDLNKCYKKEKLLWNYFLQKPVDLKQVSKQEVSPGVASHCSPQIQSNHKFYPNLTYNTVSVVFPEITTSAQNHRLSQGAAPPHNYSLATSQKWMHSNGLVNTTGLAGGKILLLLSAFSCGMFSRPCNTLDKYMFILDNCIYHFHKCTTLTNPACSVTLWRKLS